MNPSLSLDLASSDASLFSFLTLGDFLVWEWKYLSLKSRTDFGSSLSTYSCLNLSPSMSFTLYFLLLMVGSKLLPLWKNCERGVKSYTKVPFSCSSGGSSLFRLRFLRSFLNSLNDFSSSGVLMVRSALINNGWSSIEWLDK